MARSVENVYADALLSVAKESGKTEAILKDAEMLLKALRESPEFLERLTDPGRSKEEREELNRKLEDRRISLEKAGSIAEASRNCRIRSWTGQRFSPAM